MKPHEKMQLLQMFGVVDLIPELPLDDIDYIEHVAKLTNKLGLEYFMIWKGVSFKCQALAHLSRLTRTLSFKVDACKAPLTSSQRLPMSRKADAAGA